MISKKKRSVNVFLKNIHDAACRGLPTPAIQDENNRGWANNLQGVDFVFFKRHKLIDKRILCKKQ